MSNEVNCQNCKHSYSYFKQFKNEGGVIDFITMPRCRLEHEIKSDGTPVCSDCFEPR